MLRIAAILVLTVLLEGCASRLLFFNAAENPAEIKGVRVHQRLPYVLAKTIKTENCPPKTEESVIHLAVGVPYDVNVEHSMFGKGEFSIILNDDGGLKQLTLNSTPQIAEILKSAGELLEKVAKITAGTAALSAGCGAVTSEKIVNVRRLVVPQ